MKKKYALASTVKNGLLVSEHGKHVVQNRYDFDNVEDWNSDVIKFDSEDEANKFIKENEYWALEPVEFTPEIDEEDI